MTVRAFDITFKDEAIQTVNLKAGTWTFHAFVNALTYSIGLKDSTGVWHNYDLSDQTGAGWYDVQETITTDFDAVEISLLNNAGTAQVLFPMFEKGSRKSVKRPHEKDIEEAAIIKSASWEIHTSSPVIYKDAPDLTTDGAHTPVTVTGRHWVGSVMTEEGFLTVTANDETEAANASPSPVTIAPLNSADKHTYTIRLYIDANKTELLDYEAIPVVFKGAKGINAIRLHINNPVDVLPADSDGNVLSFTGTGTSIHVFEGAVELDYDGIGTENGKFNVTAAPTNITMGAITDSGNVCVVADATAMAADKASIVYTVTGKTLDGFDFTVSGEQNFTKTKMGQDGDGILSVIDYYGLSTSASVLPSTWYTTVPSKAANEFLWNYEKILYTDGTFTDTEKRVIQGKDGRGITSIVNAYGYSTDYITPPYIWYYLAQLPAKQPGQVLWVREDITYTDGSSDATIGYPVRDGEDGYSVSLSKSEHTFNYDKNGNLKGYLSDGVVSVEVMKGANTLICDSLGVLSPTVNDTYRVTSITQSPTSSFTYNVDRPNNVFRLIPVDMTVDEVELTFTIVARTNDNNTTFTRKIRYQKHKDGEDGDLGAGVDRLRTEYYLSTSSTTQTGGTWQTTVPVWVAGTYIWERIVTVMSDLTEVFGTPYLSRTWETINQLQADIIEEQAKTQFQTTIDGGLIYTALMKLFNPSSGSETAGISGNNETATNPAFYAGGTYAEALSGTAKAIIRHDGSSKFTDTEITGTVNATSGVFTGALASPFERTKSIYTKDFSNNLIVTGGTFILPWDQLGSGRLIRLIQPNSGTPYCTAPAGKYFYEDGEQKSTLTMLGAEIIELLGYTDSLGNFTGWLVLNRGLLHTVSTWGEPHRIVAHGRVKTNNPFKYHTFDGSTLTTSTGELNSRSYTSIVMPSGWFDSADGYYVKIIANGGDSSAFHIVDKISSYNFLVYQHSLNASGALIRATTFDFYFEIYSAAWLYPKSGSGGGGMPGEEW